MRKRKRRCRGHPQETPIPRSFTNTFAGGCLVAALGGILATVISKVVLRVLGF